MRKAVFGAIVALALRAIPAAAAVDVVATTSSGGMLARVVGGEQVKVTVLAPPDRDAHFLQARPSMMIAVRRAQLLVSVGAELEVGWLPAVLESAGNPRVLPGQPGYFELAAQIDLLEKGVAADRSKGDVHPAGNPHVYLDPPRMARIAGALAGCLGALDPAHAPQFKERAGGLSRMVDARLPSWREKTQGAAGVVLYHKDGDYIATLLGVPILGYVEPLPGIPPTAQHLKELVGRLRGKKGAVVYTEFQPSQGPDFLVKELGWAKTQLPLEVAVDADAQAYLALIDRWAGALAARRP
jgi:zinc/manganese transport system substrate-binding protein